MGVPEPFKKQILDEAKAGVLAVLSGELAEYKNEFLSPNHYFNILDELGAESEEDWAENTNGWQWDYWIYWTFEGKRYCQSGSGFYGKSSFGLR